MNDLERVLSKLARLLKTVDESPASPTPLSPDRPREVAAGTEQAPPHPGRAGLPPA